MINQLLLLSKVGSIPPFVILGLDPGIHLINHSRHASSLVICNSSMNNH
ncbi:MAG: hypothetical protein ACD_2C00024G0001 [uncultured bacterium (gcode 4)]|uniref:Uncharacterized protein n=1 Tax=uncultured bacterium (gcode 4) TaxID=1234023 RepID=K2GIG2_9BACT|nr:MAG: hypothetical protein ACD_2C00024G0001 [uncultured bacterium (gcode 4)]